jgi:hypothetical protein
VEDGPGFGFGIQTVCDCPETGSKIISKISPAGQE